MSCQEPIIYYAVPLSECKIIESSNEGTVKVYKDVDCQVENKSEVRTSSDRSFLSLEQHVSFIQ